MMWPIGNPSRKPNRHRAPGGPATGQMSRREVGSVRRTRPVTIPGPGRQTGRAPSWTPVPDDIVRAPSQLRFCPAKRSGRIRGEVDPRAQLRTLLPLVQLQTEPQSAGFKTHNETHNSAGSEQGCQFSENDKTWSGYVYWSPASP